MEFRRALILNPLLFILYRNDFFKYINHLKSDLYADDNNDIMSDWDSARLNLKVSMYR